MNKKQHYIAPATEVFEMMGSNIIMTSQRSSSAPEAMDTTHTASEWGDWQ